ncbi:hypothetical protein ES703_99931 [subsurface metagenome]
MSNTPPPYQTELVGKIGGAAGKEGGEVKPGTAILSTTKQESEKIGAPAAESETFIIDPLWPLAG